MCILSFFFLKIINRNAFLSVSLMSFRVNNIHLQYTALGPLLFCIELLISTLCCVVRVLLLLPRGPLTVSPGLSYSLSGCPLADKSIRSMLATSSQELK